MSWPRVKLRNIVVANYGKALKKEQRVESGAHSVFGSAGEVGFHDKALYSHPTIIVGRKGSVGEVIWAPNGGWTIDTAYYLERHDENVIDLRYLFHALKRANLARHTIATSIPGLNRDDFYETQILLPPLPEQKRIAAILDKADAIRRKRQQAIQLADDFLRAVFLDMFGDPVTNPKGIEKRPVTHLADIVTGFAFKSGSYIQDSPEAVRLCRGANTLTGYFDWDDTVYWPINELEEIESYLINAGDIILAMDRPWISSGLKICVFPENERPTYLVQRVARLRPKSPIYTDYIYACINSTAFANHCCPTETTVPHISPIELRSFEVLAPDDASILKFHDVVSKMRGSQLIMEAALSASRTAFNSLNQKAFSGQL